MSRRITASTRLSALSHQIPADNMATTKRLGTNFMSFRPLAISDADASAANPALLYVHT